MPALRNINLDKDSEFYPIKRGEFVTIRGPSGGGKTTLLNLIGTIDNSTSGTLSNFNYSSYNNLRKKFLDKQSIRSLQIHTYLNSA